MIENCGLILTPDFAHCGEGKSHMQGWTGLWMLLTAPPTSVQSEGDQLTANNYILLWHRVLKVPSETSLNNPTMQQPSH